jgi:hypothetical protein
MTVLATSALTLLVKEKPRLIAEALFSHLQGTNCTRDLIGNLKRLSL